MCICLYLTSGLRLLTCVDQEETSRRPLCGALRTNSNLVGEDHGIKRICVSFSCIEILRGYVSHFLVVLKLQKDMCLIISYFYCNSRDGGRDSWTPINEITPHILYKQEKLSPIMGNEEVRKSSEKQEKERKEQRVFCNKA